MALRDVPRRRVAALVPPTLGYGRAVLRGIIRYTRETRAWAFAASPWNIQVFTRPPGSLRCDGMIAQRVGPAEAEEVLARGTPLVVVSERYADHPAPQVVADSRAVGRAAAEHLLACGLQDFAFCGYPGYTFSALRHEGFAARLREAGFRCLAWDPDRRHRGPRTWDDEMRDVRRWLRELPKPVGLMACNDERGSALAHMCREFGIHVPGEVALVGADDDDLICEYADPPLSSVDVNAEAIGYKAAALLARLMAGEAPPAAPIRIAPGPVVARESSDVLAVADEDVARALRFIRARACDGLRVADVLEEVPVGRRTLERGFRRAIGRTPHAEIRRVQLERVRRMLAETDLPLWRIAAVTGFGSVASLVRTFRRYADETPAAYRSRFRPGVARGPAAPADKPPA